MSRLPWHTQQTTERKAFLQRFSPHPTEEFLNDTIKRRVPGTCRWILNEPRVEDWISSDGTASWWAILGTDKKVHGIHKLWLSGFEGCGRTFVSATIVEDLIKRSGESPQQATCFYFCTLLDIETQIPVNIMKALVAQLAQQHEGAYEVLESCIETGCSPDPSSDRPQEGRQDDENPELSKGVDYLDTSCLSRLLERMSRHFDRVSIVVNDVDQCDEEPKYEEVVRLLMGLADETEGNIRVMVTAGNNSFVQRLCQQTQACADFVHAPEEDIRKYVRFEIAKRIARGERFLDQEQFKQWLEDYLAAKANGAWLWASYELDVQCDLLARGAWEAKEIVRLEAEDDEDLYGPDPENLRVGMFPQGSQFDRALRNATPREEFIFYRILRWAWVSITWPRVRPTVPETCAALSLLLAKEPSIHQGNPEVGEGEILRICGPLIRVSESGVGLEFAHHTVQGYMQVFISKDRPHLQRFQSSSDEFLKTFGELAELCLNVLGNPELLWSPSTLEADKERIRARNASNPLYSYAAARWSDLSQGSSHLYEDIRQFLNSGGDRLVSWVLEFGQRRFPDHLGLDVVGPVLYSRLVSELSREIISPLHIAAALNLPNICWSMRKDFYDLNQHSMAGTPLYCALVGNAALAPGLDEPPWKRFRHYSYNETMQMGQTVNCMLDLGANCRLRIHGPGGEMVSIASQALYTCAWLEDADLFIQIMDRGAFLDDELARVLKSRSFTFDPRSLLDRPVPRPACGTFREFLNTVYAYLMARILAQRSEENDNNETLRDMHSSICSHILSDDLECGQEVLELLSRIPKGDHPNAASHFSH